MIKPVYPVLIIIIISIVVIVSINPAFTYFQIADDSAKAAILGSIFTIFATMFTVTFNAITSYYKEKNLIFQKKWEIAYPFIKEYYNPIINAGRAFRESLEPLKNKQKTEEIIRRAFFLNMVFFGLRLKFVIHGGSLILLSSTKDSEEIHNSFNGIKKNLQWAGERTPRLVQGLQSHFISNDKPKKPYSLYDMNNQLSELELLKESYPLFKDWIVNDENVSKLDQSLKDFISLFQEKIDKLYENLGEVS